MIGLSQSDLRRMIGGVTIPVHKRDQPDEEFRLRQDIRKAIDSLSDDLADAIAANNKKIEEDLRKAGVTIKNKELPAD